MLSMLLAYDDNGDVIATLDHLVVYSDAGEAIGLADFEAHEAAGRELTDIWTVEGAKGSKAWPEWLGAAAHGFRVELDGPAGAKRAAALVHRESGHRRDRAAIEGAIQARIEEARASAGAADIRDLVGGPGRPIILDAAGRNAPRPQRSALPVVPRLEIEVPQVDGADAVGHDQG
jgi:hypothetical protein